MTHAPNMHEKANEPRKLIGCDALFRGSFVRGDAAKPQPASMGVARESHSRPCRSTRPKPRGGWLKPEPLSGPGARALLSVERRSSWLDPSLLSSGDAQEATARDEAESIAGPAAKINHLPGGGENAATEIPVVNASVKFWKYRAGDEFFGALGGGLGCLHGLLIGSVLIVARGDGEKFAQCPNSVKIYFAQCPNYFSGSGSGSFSPQNRFDRLKKRLLKGARV